METVVYRSALGPVEVSAADGKLVSVRLGRSATGFPERRSAEDFSPALLRFIRWLEAYCGGCKVEAGLDWIDLSGATDFERRVYGELSGVGFGGLITYGELGRRSGFPGAARAVGRAMGRNPAPIFIPCHRVVRSDWRLGGFGAGIEWKVRLLTHEGWTVTGDRIVGGKRPVSAGAYAEGD